MKGVGGLAGRAVGALVLALSLVLMPAAPADVVAAAPGDIGWEGPTFAGGAGSPSGSKPQSKVWFNDGIWWATMYSSATDRFTIHRLDIAGQRWIDTGTLVDARRNARADALWSGTHLYIVDHVFAERGNASGSPTLLRRYSYDPTTRSYSLDAGFPVAINDVTSEAVVIDREASGRLWATWVQHGRVYVTHTTTGDTQWATPFPLPGATTVTDDDISAVVAFRSDRVGIMWSDQNTDTMWFSWHLSSDPPGSGWSPREAAFSGTRAADDHINLQSVQDGGGRILAAVKTSRSGSGVLVHLLDRDPATGTWTSHPYGTGDDGHTRPVSVIDSEAGRVHMFATAGQSGGSIYEKVAPLANISFGPGRGTEVLTDADSADINNPTTTKQNVTSATGLVVLATNDQTRQYWTHYDPLGAGPGPVAPTASFERSPAQGPAPLPVTFTDTSTGSPTSWSWSFGDGSTSTERNPQHTYSEPGTYDVSLTVGNGAGSHTATLNGAVTVTGGSDPDPDPEPVRTFVPTDDGLVQTGGADKSYGTRTYLQVRAPSPAYESYLRFEVEGLDAAPSSATLRLFVEDAAPAGVVVSRVDAAWTEASLTWNTRPPVVGGTAPMDAAVEGQWVEVDVTHLVTGDGPVALGLSTWSTNSLKVSSREGTNPPQLVVQGSGAGPVAPTASFERSPGVGAAPLSVAFTDTSTGWPESWVWCFGDGTISTERNPVHTYTEPGVYDVALAVANAAGSDAVTQVGSVVVTGGSGPSPGPVQTFVPTDDGLVQTGGPDKTYGERTYLQVRAPSPAYESYLRFEVEGLGGAPSSATLRLFVEDAAPAGVVVSRVDAAWTEASLTWNARPSAVVGSATMGPAVEGQWVEVDVTHLVAGDGPVALGLTTTSTNSLKVSSNEGTHPPELLLVA